MKIKVDTTKLRIKEAQKTVNKAINKAMVDVIIAIASDVIHLSPHITGHNRRSIAYKLGAKATRPGKPQGDEPPFLDWQPQLKEGEGAVYSTSGYGGYLETGTMKMGACPYFKPALDKNINKLPKGIKANLGRF